MRTILSFILLLITTTSLAQLSEQPELKPFSMNVFAQTFKPIKAKANGTIHLDLCQSKKDKAQELWCYQLDTKIKIAEVNQLAKFKETQLAIEPWFMQQKDRAFWKKSLTTIEFDYKNKLIKTNYDKTTNTQALDNLVFDEVSYPLHIRKLLIAGQTQFNLDLVVGHSIRNFKFNVIGKATIITKAGILDTIKVEQTYGKTKVVIWFAKRWDYLPVQFETYKSNKLYSRVTATSVNY